MERIKRIYNQTSRKYPNVSTLTCFNMAMRLGKFTNKEITDAFDILVDKKDYQRKLYDEVLNYAIELNR